MIARRGADYVARIDSLEGQVCDWLSAVARELRRVIISHAVLLLICRISSATAAADGSLCVFQP